VFTDGSFARQCRTGRQTDTLFFADKTLFFELSWTCLQIFCLQLKSCYFCLFCLVKAIRKGEWGVATGTVNRLPLFIVANVRKVHFEEEVM